MAFGPYAQSGKTDQRKDRLRLSLFDIQSWEYGVSLPTFAQLKQLAKYYRQPISLFYLKERPPFTPLKDLRHA
jgi:hypothetical protein